MDTKIITENADERINIGSDRIVWMDVFKGIMITLMVVGHATGFFNGWIYQFHMAAFFFASGYIFESSKGSRLAGIIKRFISTVWPIIVLTAFGLVINTGLHMGGVYEKLFSLPYINLGAGLKQLLFYGNCYVQWLGASWFPIVLWGVYIVYSAIYYILEKLIQNENIRWAVVAICAFAMMLCGYYFVENSVNYHVLFLPVDLVMIGQFYFAAGIFIHAICKIVKQQPYIKDAYVVLLFLSAVIGVYGRVYGWTVDFPSRSFGNPIQNIIAAIAGIYIICFVSQMISSYGEATKNVLVYLGKNSLGVLLFHFAFFKICFVILFEMGLIEKTDVCNVVLSNELGNRYWVILLFVALVGSCLVWKCIIRVRPICILLGQDKKLKEKIDRKFDKKKHINCPDETKRISRLSINAGEHEWWIILFICLLLTILAIPLYKQAIMCNDELQSRFWALQGYAAFFKHYFEDYIIQGRVTSIVILPFTMYLGFLGAKSNYVFKLFQIVSIFINIGLMGVLCRKITGNKRFAAFVGLLLCIFLPVTFEHTIPNAFVTLFTIPFACLEISLILFCEYIKNKKRNYIILSMLLFFLAQLSYEAFAGYAVLFFLIACCNKEKQCFRSKIRLCLSPLLTCIVFVSIYVISRIVFPSQYTGNSIAHVNLWNSLKIILKLASATIPGNWLFRKKYIWLESLYSANLTIGNRYRIWSVVVILFVLLVLIVKRVRRDKECHEKVNYAAQILIGCVIAIIVPVIPISIANMYQDAVGEQGFMALPVTYFGYFACVLLVAVPIWHFLLNSKKTTAVFVILIMCVLTYNIQKMNDIFANEQAADFTRLRNIEALLGTDAVSGVGGGI